MTALNANKIIVATCCVLLLGTSQLLSMDQLDQLQQNLNQMQLNQLQIDQLQVQLDEQLLDAAYNGDATEVARLLQDRADVNCVDHNGITPLMNAVLDGPIEMVSMLMKAGLPYEARRAKCDADVNRANIGGETALYWATNRVYRNS